jgi:hypothetical protein
VGQERGPLSLVSTIEELLGSKSICAGLENRNYGRRDPSRWPRSTLHTQKLALTSQTSGGRSVSIVRSRIQATEFVFIDSWYGSLRARPLLIQESKQNKYPFPQRDSNQR